ncbi:hypothetical protein [Candidatus Nitrosocosmicus sp. R]
MNKLLSMTIMAIVTTGLLSVSAIGLLQPESAVSDNANLVGQIVSKDGSSSNQGYMQSCKQSSSANECATGPTNNGEYTSNLAKSTNGPN